MGTMCISLYHQAERPSQYHPLCRWQGTDQAHWRTSNMSLRQGWVSISTMLLAGWKMAVGMNIGDKS